MVTKPAVKRPKGEYYTYIIQMIITLTILLFLCGIAGFILNRNNVILLIVAIELLLLAVTIFNSCLTKALSLGQPLFIYFNTTTTYSYEAPIFFANNYQPNIYLIFFILVLLGLNLIL